MLGFRVGNFGPLVCKVSKHVEEGDQPVVVAVISLALVFVQGHDLGIPYILWYGPYLPALTEDFVQWLQKGNLAVLEQLP